MTIRGAALLAGLLLPTVALAHRPRAGIGGFQDGLLHPWSEPAQWLDMVALGLMLGLSRPPRLRMGTIAFALCAGVGLLHGRLGVLSGTEDALLLATAALAATLTALRPSGLLEAAVLLSGGCGFLAGALSGPDYGPLGPVLAGGAGRLTTVCVGLMAMGLAVSWLRGHLSGRDWALIGLRILSAWVAAIALLMAALRFAGT